MSDKGTRAVRIGIESDTQHGAVVPPIYLSSNYTFADFGEPRQYDYARSGNPTRSHLAEALAALEGGSGAIVTSTGMGAVHLVSTTLLAAGDLLIAPHDCYGGTWRLFEHLAAKGCYRVKFVDQGDPEALATALAEGPKLVWVETPSNPLLRVVDVAAICDAAHEAGALVAVDNTFLTPFWQQPLSLGADLVVHSTTKYINGHSDVVGGAVVAADGELAERLTWWANCLGVTGGAFDSYLTLRGLRTLGARLRAHEENARQILDFLQSQSVVKRIYHPSLPSHPGHEIARRQQAGFGAMVSFELSLDEAGIRAFLGALRCFSVAESLGGVESLIAHPASMTHRAMTPEAQLRAGISGQLLRLSVGIEHGPDLVADLAQALAIATRVEA
ncbi:cystathionine gamma-synthase [Aeromonas schubertii]|uniref:Cystathionine gamma-synthase n=1 Tax=Aeromonas schubertii TaxID=652 RepID=A0A0S2SI49_9GAMM|nr:cystathionine gamma-synthase [Aeromonas schubertii]ALP41374.1 cystathionine gamma-synthase [Aeromonas schubertii]MBZ6072814.1 cystathionine gamma-synthase [Aeromonas schubertii]